MSEHCELATRIATEGDTNLSCPTIFWAQRFESGKLGSLFVRPNPTMKLAYRLTRCGTNRDGEQPSPYATKKKACLSHTITPEESNPC